MLMNMCEHVLKRSNKISLMHEQNRIAFLVVIKLLGSPLPAESKTFNTTVIGLGSKHSENCCP